MNYSFSMSSHASNGGFGRFIRSRYFTYCLFLLFMIYKLLLFHIKLHISKIDFNPLDFFIGLGSLILVSFWTLWLPRRGQRIALIVVNILLSALLYADLVYYRYFQDLVTFTVMMQASQVDSLGDSIMTLLHWSDLWFAADWLLLAVLSLWKPSGWRSPAHGAMNFPIGKSPSRRGGFVRRFSSGIAALVIGCVVTFAPLKFYIDYYAVGLFTGNWWNLSLYNVTGLLGFHVYDAYRFGKEHFGPKPVLASGEVDKVQQWFDHKDTTRSENDAMFGKYKGSNVMVIQTEAFMNFMIGKKIGGQEITPNFNRLMKESMYFSHYYHQTGQGRTSDADFSSQTSLHPVPYGSVFIRYADHQFGSLPAILKEHGYTPNAFHAYDGSFWNRNAMYETLGYDQFFSKKDYDIDEPLGWSLGDKSFFKQSMDQIEQLPQPFYSFLITLSSHHPFSLPDDVQELNVGEFDGTVFGDYLQAIHYVDAALGQLAERLKQDGLWDHTILYIYGDHDNSVKDKAVYEKFLGKSLTELDMEQIMNEVPLLVHLPDGEGAGVYDKPAGQLDMAPSLLHLLGISAKSQYMMGNDLFDGQDRFVVLRSGAYTDGKTFYIPSQSGMFEDGSCYSLKTGTTVDVSTCRAGYDRAKKELYTSDETLQYDLIPKLKQNEKPGTP
ncbi:phosphoglycerol transferase MdoB-like AlkP superfamily enzyme [Paenibacillus rhizosphaerae]|uniref:Phosphoglycerol transferase MdoB-like AlkP superfamily enzyme n=2 Tax=Paenibacillus rhizosphaerae TaxID=297318 RepID=A0A839TU26_9BACL|nr:phosphoglycerol transferase MdoB-like AlkP superfamily enzyme [Paenibacillus rhizosphaerae]